MQCLDFSARQGAGYWSSWEKSRKLNIYQEFTVRSWSQMSPNLVLPTPSSTFPTFYANPFFYIYKLYRISDNLLIQRNKKVDFFLLLKIPLGRGNDNDKGAGGGLFWQKRNISRMRDFKKKYAAKCMKLLIPLNIVSLV